MKLFVITCLNVFNVWPKTTPPSSKAQRDAKRWDTPIQLYPWVLNPDSPTGPPHTLSVAGETLRGPPSS